MDLFFFQLAIIFIPGMIWERVDALFALKRRPDQFEIIRRAFVFGLVAYAITFGVYALFGWKFELAEPAKDKAFLSAAPLRETAFASVMSLAVSIIWLYVANRKIAHRLLQMIGATKKYGDEDVWDYTFSSRNANVEYVHLRDFDNALTYAGWVETFSETEKVRELVLRDVIVYDLEGGKLYEVPRIYLARPMDKINIEFPYAGKENLDVKDP